MMSKKIYRLCGIEVAMELLRPRAKWEIYNDSIIEWDDPRPCPTIEEVYEVMELSKEFEDKIDSIWLPEQVDELVFEGIPDKNAMH